MQSLRVLKEEVQSNHYEAIIDTDKMTITYGNMVIRGYHYFKKYDLRLRDICGVFPENRFRKEDSQEYTRRTGCTPNGVVKHLNGLMYLTYIQPNQVVINKLKAGSKYPTFHYASNMVNYYLNNKSRFDQYVRDGYSNLLPLLIRGLTPESLMQNLSKSEWKRLVKKSHYWVSLLDTNIVRIKYALSVDKYPSYYIDTRACPEAIEILRTVKGLNRRTLSDYHEFPCGEEGSARLLRDIVDDCTRMSEQLGKPVMKYKTFKEYKKRHEDLNRLINLKKHSPAPFKLKELSFINEVCKSLSVDGVELSCLDSALKVAEEGTSMHHCVASYAHACAKGEYFVFSLSFNRVKSTIGVRFINNEYIFSQHYGAFNKEVSREEEDVSEKLLTGLNEEWDLK